jgi:hypothetical protein
LNAAAVVLFRKVRKNYECPSNQSSCRRQRDCQEVFLSFVPENVGAEKLYSGLGFEQTGESDEDGEIIMRFKLTDNRPLRTDH